MKRLDDMTQEELAAETARWEAGDVAKGTWKDAPEAIIANQRFYYLRGEDGVRRSIIACFSTSAGLWCSRGMWMEPRAFIGLVSSWDSLNRQQHDGMCQLLWAGTDDAGQFVVIDSTTDAVIATHDIPAVTGATW